MRPRPFLLLIAGVALALMAAGTEHEDMVELNRFEGQFAPDPDQDQDTLIEAAQDVTEDPLQFQQALQNLSWVEYTHKFELPQGARYLRVQITIDYTIMEGENGSAQPEEGPAGTLDLTFRTPDGEEFCRDDNEPPCYEIVYWTGNEKEIGPYSPPLPTVEGEWTITISGSGMEGLASQLYSGKYELVIQTVLNTPTDSGSIQRIPAPSLAAAVAAVAVIALFRPRKP